MGSATAHKVLANLAMVLGFGMELAGSVLILGSSPILQVLVSGWVLDFSVA